ncbi:MAG: DUF2330 domain-containing protein [Candidatus Hydrogenedentes bacterium]|nr:DUF2330 domain-containing protein [Candidatus Hydrogenedentota bacterium]
MRKDVAVYLFAVAFALQALADGKMYGMEKVPPEIPYQRALILFKDGIETLILQSKYEISPANSVASLGWVIPVPAPPEVASMDPMNADSMFWRLGLRTAPRVTLIKPMIFAALHYAAAGVAFFAFWLYILTFIRRSSEQLMGRRRKRARFLRISIVAWLVCFFLFVFAPALHRGRGTEGVDVISEQHVGIYDIRIVRSSNSGDLIEWLNLHEFKFGESDKAAFDTYISNDWCFVAANIKPDEDQEEIEIASDGLAAPLVLRFPHNNPVYPLMLTGTGGFDTEVLLYLASDGKMQCDGRLMLHYARPSTSSMQPFYNTKWEGLHPEGFFKPGDMDLPYLCKFKGTLTPAQMSQDIVFTPAVDKSDYREHIVKW